MREPWLSVRIGAWALMLGENAIVSYYDTKEEAQSAMEWYIATYGAPSEPLTIATANSHSEPQE